MSLPRKYKDVVQIGQGRFGTVYQATSPDKRLVAVKKYTKLSGKDIPYQILREINLMRMLNHPNIIKMLDLYMIDTEISIVMEHGGENMDEYGCKLTLKEKITQLKRIFYQIISSCLYMHKLGIMHRDLKLDNILISWDNNKEVPNVKICDFGLAKRMLPFCRDNNSYQICTLSYRPPELFVSENEKYTEAVDVWSIGCVMYEFITGRKLFSGQSEIRVLQSILQQIPTTEEDLTTLGLDNIRLEKCNTYSYYKLPMLYDITTICDEETKEILDPFKRIVQTMLVLDPNKRATLEHIIDDVFFDNVRGDYRSINSELQKYKITYYQNFKIRGEIKIPFSLRKVYVHYVQSICKDYKISPQTLFISINLFDQYISGRARASELEELKSNLVAISTCCIVLASKYIDIKPLKLEDFVSQKFSLKKFVSLERKILDEIEFELSQPTLLDLYKDIVDEVSDKYLMVAKDTIIDYEELKDKNIPEIKEILRNKIRKL
jgi:serine/threonine protein kinase